MADDKTPFVREGSPEFMRLIMERVRQTCEKTSAAAATNPKAVREAAADLYEVYMEKRRDLPMELQLRLEAGPAIIAEMVGLFCVTWAAASLASSVRTGIFNKDLVETHEARQATIETLTRSNFAVACSLTKHVVEALVRQPLFLEEIYQHELSEGKKSERKETIN